MNEESTVVKIMLAIIVIILFIGLIPETQVKPKASMKNLTKEIKKAIDSYKADHNVYPKQLRSLVTVTHPYFSEIPQNPLTNHVDWEVCDYNNKNFWYRTITEVYEPQIPLWNPRAESGIYDVRPCSKN
jgi:hypothetical protein